MNHIYRCAQTVTPSVKSNGGTWRGNFLQKHEELNTIQHKSSESKYFGHIMCTHKHTTAPTIMYKQIASTKLFEEKWTRPILRITRVRVAIAFACSVNKNRISCETWPDYEATNLSYYFVDKNQTYIATLNEDITFHYDTAMRLSQCNISQTISLNFQL